MMAVVLQLLFYNFIGPGLTISLKKKMYGAYGN